jgi:hypothetical protein
MRKFLSFFIFILFIAPAWADDAPSSIPNWGIRLSPQAKPTSKEDSEKVWDKEQYEKLHENYGSPDSPGFLNREGIDPATSDLEDKYDYEDDAPYSNEVN